MPILYYSILCQTFTISRTHHSQFANIRIISVPAKINDRKPQFARIAAPVFVHLRTFVSTCVPLSEFIVQNRTSGSPLRIFVLLLHPKSTADFERTLTYFPLHKYTLSSWPVPPRWGAGPTPARGANGTRVQTIQPMFSLFLVSLDWYPL